jgi:hypothetical protein
MEVYFAYYGGLLKLETLISTELTCNRHTASTRMRGETFKFQGSGIKKVQNIR